MAMLKKSNLIFVLTTLFWGLSLKAQPQRDFGMQFKIDIEKKISRSFSVSYINQSSFNQNTTELYYNYNDIGADYRINRNFTCDLRYRYVKLRNLDNAYEVRNVFYTDLMYVKGLGRFSALARERLQRQFYGSIDNNNPRSFIDYSRTKFQLKYRCNYYWSPYISFEFYYPLNHPIRKYTDQYKETMGLFYTINDHYKVEVYYQAQQLTDRKFKRFNNILALNLYCKF